MTMKPILSDHVPAAQPVDQQGAAARERLDRLRFLLPEQMADGLTWLAGYDPEVFDAVLDAVEPCDEGGDPDAGEDAEPFCVLCGAGVGIFLKFGLEWRHYRGDGTVAWCEVYDAGHEPVVAWRPAEAVAATVAS
jgi:hypothetical protein